LSAKKMDHKKRKVGTEEDKNMRNSNHENMARREGSIHRSKKLEMNDGTNKGGKKKKKGKQTKSRHTITTRGNRKNKIQPQLSHERKPKEGRKTREK